MNSILRAKYQQSQSKFEKHSEDLLFCLRAPENQSLIYRHQREALFSVKKYFDRGITLDQPAIVVAPTGAGKSGIVALLPYVLASKKALVLSPSLKITEQLEKSFGLRNDQVTESFLFQRKLIDDVEMLKDFLEKGKVIKESDNISNMDTWNLVIVNAQKFGTNSKASLKEVDGEIGQVRKTFDKFSTLIVDEAHHYPASTWDLIIKEFKGKKIIFLTATPFRGNDRTELLAGQQITYSITKRELIDQNIIRDFHFKELTGTIGDHLSTIVIRNEINNVLNYHDSLEPSVKHKALVLVLDTDEAKKRAREMGEIATYHTSERRTDSHLKQFEKSTCKILFVCGKLIEGKIWKN